MTRRTETVFHSARQTSVSVSVSVRGREKNRMADGLPTQPPLPAASRSGSSILSVPRRPGRCGDVRSGRPATHGGQRGREVATHWMGVWARLRLLAAALGSRRARGLLGVPLSISALRNLPRAVPGTRHPTVMVGSMSCPSGSGAPAEARAWTTQGLQPSCRRSSWADASTVSPTIIAPPLAGFHAAASAATASAILHETARGLGMSAKSLLALELCRENVSGLDEIAYPPPVVRRH
ncbi:hypothetical protein BS78_02G237300 [Paspalum vaginatum]|nr:hypothetical protein BS78_02G237300 [Paspalum vaginatum]